MFSLKEYREPTDRLPDLLPWAGLIASPGIIMQKDGLLQKTIGFRGPDLQSSSPHELVHLNAQINHALMRLGSGWSLFVEAQRFHSSDYPEARWRHPAAWVADLERSRYFAQGQHFESSYYLTFVWQLPSDASNRLEGFFYEDAGGSAPGGDPSQETAALRRDVELFRKTIGEVMTLLAPLFTSVAELGDDETLTYLHSTISTQRHPVRTPDIPLYLDAILPDEAFTAGDISMLGEHFLLTSTVSGFPSVTCPGIFDALNHLQTEYRWVTRFIALDKAEARKLLEGYRRKWTRARKGILTMLKEQAAGGEESRLQNDSAVDKADDASQALRELGDDAHSYGYFTTTITVWDRDLKAAQQKRQLVKQAIQSRGFTVQDETLNSREAWLSSLPGHVYANVRRPVVSTMNLAHMLPASSVWTGSAHNDHLAKICGVGLPHIQCSTTGATPFRLNLNVQDLGNTLVLGPPGAGKSTLLSLLGLQWLKYPKAQVVIFDKDRSARAATLAVGGAYFEPGNADAPVSFQPLANLETEDDRTWANEFVQSLYQAQGIAPAPTLKQAIAKAIEILAIEHPREERTLSMLSHRLESFDREYALPLEPYRTGGSYGQIFDASEDQVRPTAWTLFEMGHLMSKGQPALIPAFLYLFRRVEQLFTGAPTIVFIDEFWQYLRDPTFASWIQSALKTLRKKNVFVVLATQEVADALRNPLLQSTILNACPTKIFLADPEATAPAMAANYEALGLTPSEIQNLAGMAKKRDYYLRSTEGRRIFNLALGPAQLTFAGMANEADHRFLDRMVATRPPAEYAEAMLEHRGVGWAVAELRKQRFGHHHQRSFSQ